MTRLRKAYGMLSLIAAVIVFIAAMTLFTGKPESVHAATIGPIEGLTQQTDGPAANARDDNTNGLSITYNT